MLRTREAVQYLRQVGRAELGRSTRGGNLLRKSHKFDLLATGGHGFYGL